MFDRLLSKFITGIPAVPAGEDDISEYTAEACGEICELLHVSRFEAELQVYTSPFTWEVGKEEYSFFDKGEAVNATPYVYSSESGLPKGPDVFKFYPKEGGSLTLAEQEKLGIIVKMLGGEYRDFRVRKAMSEMPLIDLMTGVPNTTGIRFLGTMLAQHGALKDYTLIFMNLSNFSYTNQMIGGREGDLFLAKFAGIISSFVGAEEYVTRPGGDNFCILLRDEHVEVFLRKASRIIITVDFRGVKQSMDAPFRAGVYSLKKDDSLYDALDRASVALFMARRSNSKNVVKYRPKMTDIMSKQKQISVMFPRALGEDEFVVYYQPKVDHRTGKVVGAEALVRWITQGRMMPPIDFIPVLETEGSVCALDFFVFRKVCEDIRRWIDCGLKPVPVSVNFSKIHLHNPNLAKDILAVMKNLKVPSRYLEIELTESSGYEDFDAMVKLINTMKKKGVKTSIDDFGTGYSSLGLLKNIKADTVKLDKSFVDGINMEDTTDNIVLSSVVSMARKLDMEIIAEGVESKEQAEYLGSIGCHLIQGYLYERPVPAEKYEKYITEGFTFTL